MFDFPSFGKSISLLQKCDVAPESMIICFSILLASLLFHLFGLGISFTGIFYVMLLPLLLSHLLLFHLIEVGSSSL